MASLKRKLIQIGIRILFGTIIMDQHIKHGTDQTTTFNATKNK